MKCLKYFILLFITHNVWAQTISPIDTDFNTIIGRVTNEDNIGIPGASVRIQGKAGGVTTNAEGYFSLYATSKDIIVVEYIGFQSTNIPLISTPSTIDKRNIKVVIAYKNITNVSVDGTGVMSVNSFDFPPAKGYTLTVLSDNIFNKCKYLGEINDKLIKGLESLGYDEKSYFIIPNGFALITRIESIDNDGKSVMNSERFAINESRTIRLSDFFSPRAGRYRLIAFLITNRPFAQGLKNLDLNKAKGWSTVGYNVLPSSIKGTLNDSNYNCTVLIYEFSSDRPNTTLKIQTPIFSALQHLQQSKILKAISE